MRPGQQNKRMRGRGRRGPNPLSRSYESNGPDVKVRGTAAHIAEKYMQLARDAHASGDPVLAESYLQHAEHYFRIIAAAQSQQQAGSGEAPQPRYNGGGRYDSRDEDADDGPSQDAGAQHSADQAPQKPAHESGNGANGANGPEAEAAAQPSDDGEAQGEQQSAPAPRRRRRRTSSDEASASESAEAEAKPRAPRPRTRAKRNGGATEEPGGDSQGANKEDVDA